MKSLKITILIILVAFAGTAFWYFKFREEDKPLVLDTENPAYGYISRSVTATGTVQPVDTVTVGTQVSGTIKSIFADFNSKVKKGELIAQLDKSLLIASVDQYKANLLVAKSQLVYQKSTYDRQNLLYQTGAISKADYETAQYNYSSAEANVQSVQAQLDAANKNLQYSDIYSPVDGVVMTRNVSMGQTVAASFSTPTLFVIAKDITKMQVQGAVDEADIGNVKVNQRVTFTVDAYPDDIFPGTVSQIRLEPTVSANVVTYSTIISAQNDNMKLKPGMTANITVFTKEDSNVLLIPAKALKFQPTEALAKQFKIGEKAVDSSSMHRKKNINDTARRRMSDTTGAVKKIRAFVWVKKNDSLVEKKIITGLNDDANVEVFAGLTTEDEVVTGVENPGTKNSAKPTTQKSPFMPARPGANRPQTGGGTRPQGGAK
ncbi:MAG TPA: efflux RND transporter periplasmic adaptor subunit [Puia sp.]|nr:efflux RND transporter periplasmic adaptor subunit [Puia sp.]